VALTSLHHAYCIAVLFREYWAKGGRVGFLVYSSRSFLLASPVLGTVLWRVHGVSSAGGLEVGFERKAAAWQTEAGN
jgi:hypothetical protein